MDDTTSTSERKDITQVAKQNLPDAISMILCDEADMVVGGELHMNCCKSVDVAERIIRLIANVDEEAGREKSDVNAMVSFREIFNEEMKRINKELEEFDERRRDFLLGQKQELFNLSDKIKDSEN